MAQLVKESACNAGDVGSISGLGWSPGEGNPPQYSGLENFMDCMENFHGVGHDWLTFTFNYILMTHTRATTGVEGQGRKDLVIKPRAEIKWNTEQNSSTKQQEKYKQTSTEEMGEIQNRTELKGNSEKAMAPHSSTLVWKIPWTEEPGRLQSLRSLRVGHNRATSFSLSTFMHWRRKWQPTPVFLPGESQGRGSLMVFCLWGRTELDTTEVT